MFGRVCKRFGQHVIRSDLGAFGQPLVDSEFEVNGIAERRASILIVGPSPPRDRIAGCIPADPITDVAVVRAQGVSDLRPITVGTSGTYGWVRR